MIVEGRRVTAIVIIDISSRSGWRRANRRDNPYAKHMQMATRLNPDAQSPVCFSLAHAHPHALPTRGTSIFFNLSNHSTAGGNVVSFQLSICPNKFTRANLFSEYRNKRTVMARVRIIINIIIIIAFAQG